MKTNRRDFLKSSSLALGASLTASALLQPLSATEEAGQDQAHPEQTRKGDMLYRSLGHTGQQVSLVGLGGFHIGKIKDEAESIQIIRTAIDRGITFLDNSWVKSNTVSPIDCLHYAMHLPVSVVITGIDSMPILDQAFEAVRTYEPFSSEQLAALLAKTQQAAATGKFELYKTSNQFDSTAQNPRFLGYPQ